MVQASLSTVIVAHNSRDELRRSLPVLARELSDQDELILVENSPENAMTATELEALVPGARLIRLPDNPGFAAGANRGAEAAQKEVIVLLNPDAEVQSGWAAAIRAPLNGPWAAWMGLVLLEGGEAINTSGGVLHFTGFGWAGQMGEPLAAAPVAPREVGFVSGACLAIPRQTWARSGGFAEHFFMYCEDVDLSLKLRLPGGRLAVVPDARVEHSYSFAKGELKWRLLERNRWATILRDYPAPVLVTVFPALLAAELAVWAVALRGGWARMKLLATLDLLRILPRLRRERRAIQATRQISARDFAAHLTAELNSPYLGAVGRYPLIGRLLHCYWRAARALLGPARP
jgi:GT2 family glycosyltransferase